MTNSMANLGLGHLSIYKVLGEFGSFGIIGMKTQNLVILPTNFSENSLKNFILSSE